jgi:hypothetical protein
LIGIDTGAFIFHMSVPCDKTFPWVPKKFTLWPWPWCLTYLLKTFTLAISFEWYVLWIWYFTWLFLVTRPFSGYQQVWPCDLDFYVWPTFCKFNLSYIFLIVRIRFLLFHMNVCCDKTFPWVPTGLTLWSWPLRFTDLHKNLTLAIYATIIYLLFMPQSYITVYRLCSGWSYVFHRPILHLLVTTGLDSSLACDDGLDFNFAFKSDRQTAGKVITALVLTAIKAN